MYSCTNLSIYQHGINIIYQYTNVHHLSNVPLCYDIIPYSVDLPLYN